MLFPRLYVLDEISARVREAVAEHLATAVFICVQHLLETTGSLIESLIELGAQPASIFLCGKCYSTNASVVERLRRLGVFTEAGSQPRRLGSHLGAMTTDVAQLWERALAGRMGEARRPFVILDDGGLCISKAAASALPGILMAGVEQTTSGLGSVTRAHRFPVIQVASCAAKTLLEPPLIATAVLERLQRELHFGHSPETCGVIGIGNIGRKLAETLLQDGHRVFVFDKNPAASDSIPGAVVCVDSAEVFSRASYIFGCTGEDVLNAELAIPSFAGTRTLVSCSSRDTEFRSVLEYIARAEAQCKRDPLNTIVFAAGAGSLLRVVRGGFPANFDRTSESVPANDIQLTRGLLFGALVQALFNHSSPDSLDVRGQMLNPAIQRFVVSKWVNGHKGTLCCGEPRGFSTNDAIRANSRGRYVENPSLESLFSLT